MEEKEQNIFIYLDDSGKMTENELYCVYGGILFVEKKEKDKFITQYRIIINKLKSNYCKNSLIVNEKKQCLKLCKIKKCPELKCNKINSKHSRWIINYLKKYTTFGFVIENEKVYPHIITNTSSKGRFLDFQIRVTLKEVIKRLIKNKIIDPYQPLKLYINIDEQTTKSNGYYNLKDGLIEELLHGITNFDYNKKHEPILFGKFTIELKYVHSDKNYGVQASDIIAGTIRRNVINNQEKNLEFVDYLFFKP